MANHQIDIQSRDIPVAAERAALLVIDVQKYSADPSGSEFRGRDLDDYAHYFERLENQVLPNIAKRLAAFRGGGWEVIYTVIEALTADGRDASLDYKISGLIVPKGSRDAEVPEAIAPLADEIILPKTSSSVFNSTTINYVLRNLGVEYVVMAGLVTDQCVESAIRDAADLGYLVTQATDACCTYTQARHDNSLTTIKGYCRQRTTAEIVEELAGQR